MTLNDFALQLVNSALDYRHPLWCLWFVTGLPTGQVALVVGIHHVVADGISTIGLIGALMDGADPGEAIESWSPRPAPGWGELARDALRDKVATLGSVGTVPAAIVGQWRVMARTRGAPRTSLNRPVGYRRRLAAVELGLEEARSVAHAHDSKINDLVLALAAGGIRALLLSRGEPVDDVRLHVSVAMSLRPNRTAGEAGNQAGGIAVRVPLASDPHRRLRAISAESVQAKRLQLPTAGNTFLVSLARIGLLRYMSRHQKMINVVESDVTGPAGSVSLLGAPVAAIVPIGTLVGNLALSFLALSYSGRLTIAVQADAEQFPDLPVLIAAMRREWAELSAT